MPQPRRDTRRRTIQTEYAEQERRLVARVAGDRIIIERDVNDKPLVDALVQAGVPRHSIVLAYAGESVTDSSAA